MNRHTAIMLLALAGALPAIAADKTEPLEQRLYRKNCSSCHGADAKGKARVAKANGVPLSALDLTDGGTRAKTADMLLEAILDGKGRMKGLRGRVSEEEAAMILGYVRSLGEKKP